MFLVRMAAVSLAMTISLSGVTRAEEGVWVDGQNLQSRFLRVYGASLPPVGHVRFCESSPHECITKASVVNDGRFSLTEERWRELQLLNSLVNKMIQPITDQELYGQVEHWTYPTNYKGDCEDYVLLKRQKLIERGWPESALLITVVLDENREGHAILTARTVQGDFILDNKNNHILPWNKLPYTFVKRQSFSNPSLWVSLLPDNRWEYGSQPTANKE